MQYPFRFQSHFKYQSIFKCKSIFNFILKTTQPNFEFHSKFKNESRMILHLDSDKNSRWRIVHFKISFDFISNSKVEMKLRLNQIQIKLPAGATDGHLVSVWISNLLWHIARLDAVQQFFIIIIITIKSVTSRQGVFGLNQLGLNHGLKPVPKTST